MRALLCLLLLACVPVAAAQFPPVLRQSLTTNTASNPSAAGQIPIWSGTSWIPGTNLAGLNITNINQSQWTNFTVANADSELWRGIRDTNDVAGFASLTNTFGDRTTIINLGNVAGNVTDYTDATGIVNIGDYAGNSQVLTNAMSVFNIGPIAGYQQRLDGSSRIFNMSEYAGSGIRLTNVIYMLNVGHQSGLGTEIHSSQELHNYGYQSGYYLGASNVFNIYNFGTGAGGGSSRSAAPNYTNVSGVFNYGYYVGGRQRLFSSTNIYNYGTGSGSNGIVSTSGAIYNYGKFSGARMVLTNCENIYTFGTEAGTNIVMNDRTNVFLFGHVGAVNPFNNEYYIGGPQTTNILQGTFRYTNNAGQDKILMSDSAGNARWDTNISTVVITNLYVTNINGVGAGAFTNLYWTNDGVVLKGTAVGMDPRFALRWGSLDAGGYVDAWTLTNVGFWSVAIGSNLIARGNASVAFGQNNEVRTNANNSTIAGGRINVIATNVHHSFIGSGASNRIVGDGAFLSFLGGGSNNLIQILPSTDLGNAVIGGGGDNLVTSNYATIVGGFSGDVLSDYAFMGGGINNTIGFGGTRSVIGGGEVNIVRSPYATVGGGRGNIIGPSGASSTTAAGGMIGGGHGNTLASAGANSTNAVIGGGTANSIVSDSHHSFIGGGRLNAIDQATNVVIVGGHGNTSNGDHSFISGGLDNDITTGDFGGIVGSSNLVSANGAFVVGTRTTNSLASSVDIGLSGNESTALTKSTFTATNTIIRTSLATAPDTVVTLSGDNQVVDITKRSYVRIQSDSAVASQRTFVLTGTNVAAGARITLEWVGTNAGELVDDSAMSGAGNHRMSATWTPTQYDSVSFIFNGTDVIETARSTN